MEKCPLRLISFNRLDYGQISYTSKFQGCDFPSGVMGREREGNACSRSCFQKTASQKFSENSFRFQKTASEKLFSENSFSEFLGPN